MQKVWEGNTSLLSCSRFVVSPIICKRAGIWGFLCLLPVLIQNPSSSQEVKRKISPSMSVGVSCVTSNRFCKSKNSPCALCIGSILGNTAWIQCTGTCQSPGFCSCHPTLCLLPRPVRARVTGNFFASERQQKK